MLFIRLYHSDDRAKTLLFAECEINCKLTFNYRIISLAKFANIIAGLFPGPADGSEPGRVQKECILARSRVQSRCLYGMIYLLTYLLTYLLHGAESFLRS